MTDPASFERTGVDPVSRCTACGAAVTAQGQDQHTRWHGRMEWLLDTVLTGRPSRLGTIDMP
jgi:hypothetical protein